MMLAKRERERERERCRVFFFFGFVLGFSNQDFPCGVDVSALTTLS